VRNLNGYTSQTNLTGMESKDSTVVEALLEVREELALAVTLQIIPRKMVVVVHSHILNTVDTVRSSKLREVDLTVVLSISGGGSAAFRLFVSTSGVGLARITAEKTLSGESSRLGEMADSSTASVGDTNLFEGGRSLSHGLCSLSHGVVSVATIHSLTRMNITGVEELSYGLDTRNPRVTVKVENVLDRLLVSDGVSNRLVPCLAGLEGGRVAPLAVSLVEEVASLAQQTSGLVVLENGIVQVVLAADPGLLDGGA